MKFEEGWQDRACLRNSHRPWQLRSDPCTILTRRGPALLMTEHSPASSGGSTGVGKQVCAPGTLLAGSGRVSLMVVFIFPICTFVFFATTCAQTEQLGVFAHLKHLSVFIGQKGPQLVCGCQKCHHVYRGSVSKKLIN